MPEREHHRVGGASSCLASSCLASAARKYINEIPGCSSGGRDAAKCQGLPYSEQHATRIGQINAGPFAPRVFSRDL
jgi:hypothetical protein